MRMMMRGLFLLLMGAAPALASASSLQAVLSNRRGIDDLKLKLSYPAYQEFLKALSNDPLNPRLHLNLGLAFAAGEEWEKAAQSFASAAELARSDKELQFDAYFDWALAATKKGDIDQALSAYQKALAIHPDSIEVKTNIELLWKGQGQGKGKSNDSKSGDKNKNKKDSQGDQNKNKDKNQSQQQQQPQHQQPKPFRSKDLSRQEVRKILEEIKNQEQSIRAKEYDRKSKEPGDGKDW